MLFNSESEVPEFTKQEKHGGYKVMTIINSLDETIFILTERGSMTSDIQLFK